jgi:lysophospholipase L1-like esterase
MAALLPMVTRPRVSPAHLGAGVLLGCVMLALRWQALQRFAAIGEAIADRAQPFQRLPEQPHRHLLVVGDSTGVGTGAAHADHSLAGRLAHDHPHVAIVNRARNGATTRDAIGQLGCERDGRYDVVLVHVGANDILRRTPLPQLACDVEALMARAQSAGRHVLVTTTPNVGLAPAFFPPLSWWLTLRSRQVRNLFAATCRSRGAHYANFFHPRSCDPFSREWQRYFAADRFHPSSECYAFVYRALLATTPLAHWLALPSARADLRADVDELGKEGDVERLAQESDAG